MGLFDKIKEPVFLKDSTKDEKVIEELKELAESATGDVKKQIEKEIKKIKYGILGEKKIEFELKNSHIPMFVIHDLYLKNDDLTAQIDYLVITKRRNFVIECKNFYGNLTICDNGNFIRTVTKNGKVKKERIYSPITQNRRHLELIKKIRSDERTNFITKALFEKSFHENYRSVVVLANYKGFLNTKYAPNDIAEQVINADQLIDYINKVNSEKGAENCSEKNLEELAQYFMQQDKENPVAYLEKYKKMVSTSDKTKEATTNLSSSTITPLPLPIITTKQVTNNNDSISKIDNCSNCITSNEKETTEQIANSEVPICKRCGAPMIKRIAKKGKNKGNSFWGCSRYPKCRYVLDIEVE